MSRRNRRNFSPEFLMEFAQLLLDQHYTAAADDIKMNIDKSEMEKWDRQPKEELVAKSPIVLPLKSAQIEMRKMKE